ncbi:cysteine desulfurase [Patescibacteria group bacterium]|nr:MAG: cysteine desulfurase [Patescibacteria group bacterium]
MNFKKIRNDFPILNQKINGKPLVYFDNAATSQKPKQVIEAVSNFYKTGNANIHRGIHALSEIATADFEKAREKTAEFIGANNKDEIIFTRNATESINLIAYSWGRTNIKKGDEILLTQMEHHANIVPWQILAKEVGAVIKYIPITKNGELDLKILPKLLNKNTKLVGLVHASNVLGTIIPVEKIAKAAKKIGAAVLVDGAQSIPNMPVDVRKLGCDFFVFSSHKMMGPSGVGVLWAKKELLEKMPPFLGGGEMIKEVNFEKDPIFQDLPSKFEAGTPNIEGVIGLSAAIDYLNKIGMARIRKYEQELIAYALNKFSALNGVKIYGPETAHKRVGVICFNLGKIHAHDLASLLDEEGIAIRSGHHCAMPLMKVLNISACARISFGIYNTGKEIDYFIKALKRIYVRFV